MYISEFLLEPLQQEANLQRVKKGDAKASVHRMEIDRIRFVLSSYLRSRLQKVSRVEQRRVQNRTRFTQSPLTKCPDLCSVCD